MKQTTLNISKNSLKPVVEELTRKICILFIFDHLEHWRLARCRPFSKFSGSTLDHSGRRILGKKTNRFPRKAGAPQTLVKFCKNLHTLMTGYGFAFGPISSKIGMQAFGHFVFDRCEKIRNRKKKSRFSKSRQKFATRKMRLALTTLKPVRSTPNSAYNRLMLSLWSALKRSRIGPKFRVLKRL